MIKQIDKKLEIEQVNEIRCSIFYENVALPENIIVDKNYNYVFFREPGFYETDLFYNLITKIRSEHFFVYIKNNNIELNFEITNLNSLNEWNLFCNARMRFNGIDIDWAWIRYADTLIIFDCNKNWAYHHDTDFPSIFLYQEKYNSILDETNSKTDANEAVNDFVIFMDDIETRIIQEKFINNYIIKS